MQALTAADAAQAGRANAKNIAPTTKAQAIAEDARGIFTWATEFRCGELARGWLASWTRRVAFRRGAPRTGQRTGKFDGIAGCGFGTRSGSALGRRSLRQA